MNPVRNYAQAAELKALRLHVFYTRYNLFIEKGFQIKGIHVFPKKGNNQTAFKKITNGQIQIMNGCALGLISCFCNIVAFGFKA